MIYTLEDFDQMLDETHEPVVIAGIEFMPSYILKNCDPNGYDVNAADYLSMMEEEFLKILDSEFLKQDTLLTPPTLNQASPNAGQSNDATVGKILTTVLTGDFDTGTINYSDFRELRRHFGFYHKERIIPIISPES